MTYKERREKQLNNMTKNELLDEIKRLEERLSTCNESNKIYVRSHFEKLMLEQVIKKLCEEVGKLAKEKAECEVGIDQQQKRIDEQDEFINQRW